MGSSAPDPPQQCCSFLSHCSSKANGRKPNSSGNLNTAQQQTDKKQQSQNFAWIIKQGKKTPVEPLRNSELPDKLPWKEHKRQVQGRAISITQHSASGFSLSVYNDKLTGAGIEQNMEDFNRKNQDTVPRMAALNSSYPWTHICRHLKPSMIINKLIRTASKRNITWIH